MKSYIKFLSRNKLYTAVEAVGLAVGLAFVILIGNYVLQQHRVAHKSPHWERTFVLGSDDYLGVSYWEKDDLATNIPEVISATHMANLWRPVVEVGNTKFNVEGIEGDANLFEVFPQYRIVEGSASDFVAPTDVIISQSLAQRIAHNGENLLGSTLKLNGTARTIKAIYADFGSTSFLMPFEVIAHSSSTPIASQPKRYNRRTHCTWYRVRDDANLADIEAKVKALLLKNYGKGWGEQNVETWRPWRMDEAFYHSHHTYLTRVGDKLMVKMLTAVVLLLLLSAIFNYINLGLALTSKRSKEMATRRLLGASPTSILWKYIGESVAFTAVCFAAALVLAHLLVPMVRELLTVDGEIGVALSLTTSIGHMAAYAAGIVLLGTICGVLPALAILRLKPIDAVRGTLRLRNKMVVSRIFIAVQNVLAVTLIALSLVMELQMRHMLNRPMHSATDNLYYIGYSQSESHDMTMRLVHKVRNLPFVTQVGIGMGVPGSIDLNAALHPDDNDYERIITLNMIAGDSTYFSLMGLEVEENFGHPLQHSVWVSRSLFNELDSLTTFPRSLSRSSRMPLEYLGGVVTDFPTAAASISEIKPHCAVMVVPANKIPAAWALCMLIKTTGESAAYDEQIQQAYREYMKENLGLDEVNWEEFGFLRNLHEKKLRPLRRTLRLLELFTVLAVIIAMLGLLAMSTYFAGEHTKQIAVRKVFGADVRGETWRNVRGYMVLTGIACAIGIPLAIWGAQLYLTRFAYRIDNYSWIFAVAVAITLAIAFASVLWQTLRAAHTNPTAALRKE
ncbi:MAG: ABC transporter permease [Bacteroidales bacterium]|nr:ABC transporter permease [Bacteroidales bacterium]